MIPFPTTTHGDGNFEHGSCGSRIGKPTRNYYGIELLLYRDAGLTVMDLAALKEHAERCRRLARQAEPFTEKRLLHLTSEYEARIAELKPKRSTASRILKSEPERD
jgi:hypothetical protein